MRTVQCSNCGKKGHNYKNCKHPVSSYGVVNVNIADTDFPKIKQFLKKSFSQASEIKMQVMSRKYPEISCIFSNKNNYHDTKAYTAGIPGSIFTDKKKLERYVKYKDKIMFMMVSRKFSLGFVDFVRGKYNVYDTDGIKHLFEQMYPHEIAYIRNYSYDDLLYMFLNIKNQTKEEFISKIYEGYHSGDYCDAKVKHELLATSPDVPLSLHFYVRYTKPHWHTPEWGFPKGKRNLKFETDINCACREFEEETGYGQIDYHILDKVEPFKEYLIGTNGHKYRHIYYVSVDNTSGSIKSDFDTFEIGEIKWFTFAEAIRAIRPYHVGKKQVLAGVYLFILNALINNVTI